MSARRLGISKLLWVNLDKSSRRDAAQVADILDLDADTQQALDPGTGGRNAGEPLARESDARDR